MYVSEQRSVWFWDTVLVIFKSHSNKLVIYFKNIGMLLQVFKRECSRLKRDKVGSNETSQETIAVSGSKLPFRVLFGPEI